MKGLKQNVFFALFLLISLLIIVFYIVDSYRSEQVIIERKLNSIFREAINQDMIIRRDISINYFKMGGRTTQDPNLPVTVTTKEGTRTIHRRGVDTLSIEQRTINVFQSVLRHKNPINPSVIDSLFQKILLDEEIRANTAVVYWDNVAGKRDWFGSNDTVSLSKVLDKPLTLGVEDEVSLQAYAKISPITILNQLVYLIGLFLFVFLLFVWFARRSYKAWLLHKRLEDSLASEQRLYKEKVEELTNKVREQELILEQKNALLLKNQEEIVSVNAELEDLYQTIAGLKDEVNVLIGNENRLIDDINRKENELTSLQRDGGCIAEQAGRIHLLQEEIDRIRGELLVTQQTAAQKNVRISELNRKMQDQKKNEELLRQETMRLRREVENRDNTIKLLHQELERKQDECQFILSSDLYFNKTNNCLYHKNRSVQLCEQTTTLLRAFVESDNGDLSKEEIISVLQGASDNTVHKAMSRSNKEFRAKGLTLHFENRRRTGYHLVVGNLSSYPIRTNKTE